MLNNVKDFVISKKVAFKAGGGPSKVVDEAVYCLIGSVIAFVIQELIEVNSAIKDGEELIRIRETFLRNKD